LIILIILDENYKLTKLLVMNFSPIACSYIPLRSKYSQHPVLKQIPSFTPI
jgi:hypothetical protein